MLWNKKIIITSFGILFLVFCSVFVSSACYAIDDVSETVSSSSLPSYFFTSLSGSQKSQYQYLKVSCSSDSDGCSMFNIANTIQAFNFDIRVGSSSGPISCGTIVIFPYSSDVFYKLCSFGIYNSSFSGYPIFARSNYRNYSQSNVFSLTLTLTNSLPGSVCPEPPTATLNIDSNGTYDVSDYSEAVVNVPQVSETPYDDKLDHLIQAVYVCAGTMLVIYFFYCIYRMLIKGVK